MNAQPDASAPAVTDGLRARTGPRSTGRLSRTRFVRTVGIAVAAVLSTSACAAGQLAQTADEKPSIDGVNRTVGAIDLRAVSIQAPDTGTPAYVAGTAAKLQIVFVNTSNKSDTLTSITSSAVGGWAAFTDYVDAFHVQQARLSPSSTLSPSSAATTSAAAPGSTAATSSKPGSSSGRLLPLPSVSRTAPLPKGVRSVLLPPDQRLSFGTPEAKGAILLLPVTEVIRPGSTIRVTFTFQAAGSITVPVPVQLGTNVPAQVGGAGATD